jgi:hypothetical protein
VRSAFSIALAFTVLAAMSSHLIADQQPAVAQDGNALLIGWASADVTPEKPVLIAGQFHARVSEGVMDPITVTAMALEAIRDGKPAGRVVMVSCDFSMISEGISDSVRACVQREVPGLDPMSLLFNATHTHTGPVTLTRPRYVQYKGDEGLEHHPYGVELDTMSPVDYVAFASERIAQAVKQAWDRRAPGGIAFGLGHAVVGHNRLITYDGGKSRLYGKTDDPKFSHVEGYTDHSVHALLTYNKDRQLTGLVINIACPSQISEHAYELSADFWHETRQELRRRHGDGLHVLTQCASAGDQSPHILINKRAEQRMWKLAGRTQREDVAVRIADAVTGMLPHVEKDIDWTPTLIHRAEILKLPRRLLAEEDAQQGLAEAAKFQKQYEAMLADLEAHPELRQKPRWYTSITRTHSLMKRNKRVADRYERQKVQPTLPIEVHVVRLGNVAFASNPFEYYLDFGLQIRSRSKALQTFLVQLAGPGSYVPTERSVAGGGYGAVPASTEIGPDGGRQLADWTVDAINAMWDAPKQAAP